MNEKKEYMSNAGRKPRVTDDELIDTIRQLTDTNENIVVTTPEITDELPIAQRSVYDRLIKLNDEERVQKKKVGARAIVWWVNADE
ncbi:hypothetical protein [Halalkalicoccus jeotgali]|uniref:Transcription regulator TrmB N-terminal domain-containing protein n=1 Tax=Halalkalicoccus jeotgali (strain DSM 18796 / CECT 7217 / JCM 14584 / KCTC 4019 / B3) TaxID=795797 RepID=D8JD96_HALJB|nr:hypothetical protein [Halalkalicoccus jeotgali]ADJ17249.1 hypothetical protein HacjB3_19568 [Halalkalicoccus jeotgali B3]ELY41960.1 hypothetical protein C497_00120 [Halalkalicoccus jeotgali B3]